MKYSFYCLYNPSTGQITASGNCPTEEIPDQCPAGEAWVATDRLYNGGQYYINSGKLVETPPRPSPQHFFDYTTKQWEPNFELAWLAVRTERDQKLQQSDWTQLPDVPIDTKEAWAEYRQALRDVTDQPDPFNIVWPTPPG
jgi:hypothetical protein